MACMNSLRNITFLMFFLLTLIALSPGEIAFAQNQNLTTEIYEDVSTPIKTTISIDKFPLLKEPTTLRCEVTSAEDAPGTKVEIELPHDAQVIKGEIRWEGDLYPGDIIELSPTIIFNTAGNKAIFCRALRAIDTDNVWGDLAELYLSVGETETLKHFSPIPSSERDLLGEPEALENENVIEIAPAFPAPKKNDNEVTQPPTTTPSNSSLINEEPADSLPGDLTITGRWRFYDRNDNLTSEQILVEIVRGDNSNWLASCYTDVNGYYSCGPFVNPGSVGVRSRFISYVAFSLSDVLVTVNPDWGTVGNASNAFGTTTPVKSYSDGTRDIGAYTVSNGSSYERAYWITKDLILVWKYIWFGAGSSESAGSSTVQWKIDSTDGTYYSRGGNIHLKGADPLSNTVVGHEFGHNIMYRVYGNWMPTTYCPSPHYVNRSSHVNCAWTEGWANFLPLAVNNDPVYRWASGSSINLETPTWGTSNWDNGDDVEGRVAGALWDIFDNINDGDDTYSDGSITNIWDTLYHQNDYNFSQYWSAWQSRGHNVSGACMSIYQNTIDYYCSCSTPAAPTGVLASDGTYTDKVRVTWNASTGATSYEVYRATSSGGTKTMIGTPSTTSYDDTSAAVGTTYYYWVKAMNDCGSSAFSAYNTGYRAGTAPSAPYSVSASDGAYTNKVRVSWNASSGATSYEVYRATSSGGTKSKIGTPSITIYDDTSASVGTTYYYWIKAKNAYGTSGYTSYDTGYRAGTAPPAPSGVSASDGAYTNKVRVSWNASSGATSYEVYRATSSGGTKSKIGTPSVTLYNDTSALAGTIYYYWIKAKNAYGTSGYSSYNTGYRCPDCSGGKVENVKFRSGTNCECTATGTLTIGPEVTVESEATVMFKGKPIKVQSGFNAKPGSEVGMKQQ